LRERGIVAGLPLGGIDAARDNELLVCCTEMTSPDAIDRYAAAAAEVIDVRASDLVVMVPA
jgi:hypothetical protein